MKTEQLDKKGEDVAAYEAKYKVAVEMWQQEHTRWNQWTLFFFGLIATLFTFWGQAFNAVKDFHDKLIWVPCFIAVIIFLAWVVVALTIRASGRVWVETIKKMEKEKQGEPVTIFWEGFRKENRWHDFLKIFWLKNEETPSPSVTKVLVRLGVFFAFVFLALGVFILCGKIPPNQCKPSLLLWWWWWF